MSSHNSPEPQGAGEGAQPVGTGEVRTYRGRSVEELIPQIRAELGPNAIILRERQGLTGGVGGFFAQRCVEIEAQAGQRVSVYDDEDEFIDEEIELDDDAFAAASAPGDRSALPAPEARQLPPPAAEAARIPAEPVPAAEPVPPAEPVADTVPVAPAPAAEIAPAAAPQPVSDPFARVLALPETQAFATSLEQAAVQPDGFGAFTAAAPIRAEPETPAATPAAPSYIAFDELAPAPAQPAAAPGEPAEPSPVTGRGAVPATPVSLPAALEPIAIPVPVTLEAAPAPEPVVSVFRPRAIDADAPADSDGGGEPAAAVADRNDAELTERLIDRGFSTDFVRRLIDSAIDSFGEGADLVAATETELAAMLPAARPLPIVGAIAVVGPGGAGKSRAVAALAATYARAGQSVTVARLGTPERSNELAELLRGETVEVIPSMRTRATARAVGSARERGLVIIDTTSASAGDTNALEVLAETLAPFALDGVLLAVPATFTARAAARLAESYRIVAPTGLLATHVDEADHLGTVAEVAIAERVGLSHTHAGTTTATAISELDAETLARELMQ